MEQSQWKSYLSKSISYIILIFFAFITLFPFYWMILTSLKDPNNYIAWPPEFWPKQLHFENFKRVLEIAPFGTYITNTLIVVAADLFFNTIIVTLAAFGFAHYTFKGREFFFLLILATMMIPSESLIIANFRTIAQLKLIDTYWAVFLPYMASAFNIYLLREAFRSVPRQMYLAAKIDGCSDFGYFIKILLPICRPTLITISLLKIIGSWNAFLWPLLVTNSRSMRTISYGLVNFQTEASSNFALIMAASLYTVVPMLLLYIFARKKIIEGIAKGGVKG